MDPPHPLLASFAFDLPSFFVICSLFCACRFLDLWSRFISISCLSVSLINLAVR